MNNRGLSARPAISPFMLVDMPPYSRREVLRTASAALVAGAVASVAAPDSADAAKGTGFLHGVASGDPLPDGVVIWTRVTPTAQSTPGSGRGPSASVRWEVATDEQFRSIVRRSSVSATAARDHTVKVAVTGLRPGVRYWYRFRFGSVLSPVGRTRTAPAASSAVARLRVGVVSCSNWQAGWFSAYRHLASRTDIDVVIHLGDYVYEYAPGEYQARDVVVRPHDPAAEMVTLADYRRRHAQYKTDRDLQALHAAVPFIVTWDDHESANDAWSEGAENHTEGAEGTWTARRAAAAKAYAEWMPVRFEPGLPLYRRFQFGGLASLSMLDLRSNRSQQVSSQADTAVGSPDRTITGSAQMSWLLDGLSSSAAQWKFVGNPVMISPVQFPSTLSVEQRGAIAELIDSGSVEGFPYNVDQWDGYTADRNRVVRHLADRGIRDTVFLTGDIHSAWACEIPVDRPTYPVNGRTVGVELVCTSVTSDNLDDILRVPPRTASLAVETAVKAANPHIKYLDFDSHGYSVLDVTPAAVRMDWYVLSDRTNPAATSTLSTSWQVAAGSGRVTQVGGVL